jgi:hypothetical protein
VGIENVDWGVALAHYHADRLEEAYEAALDIGAGLLGRYLTWFRTIEAEALTRRRSELRRITEFAELEVIPDEIGGGERLVADAALRAFQDVGSRFGYSHESQIRLTVLAQESDAPWLYGRFGYCIAKNDLYKICVPLSLLGRPQELYDTLRHEYAHVVVGMLTKDRAPRWVDEMVAMLAEGGVRRDRARLFATGEWSWLSREELEAELLELEDSEGRFMAYLQAGLVGMYLASRFGEGKVGEFLRAFGSGGHWIELWRRVRGSSLDEIAIRAAFGLKPGELFESAFQWTRAGR